MSTILLEKVKTIKALNNIAESGLNVFNKGDFKVDNDSENPDAIVLRSFNMHTMEFGNQLKAIARAGAGVNNIPVDKCTEQGIVVFNTPGANANAVKEMVLTTLMASSRNFLQVWLGQRHLKAKGNRFQNLLKQERNNSLVKKSREKLLA